MFDISNGIKNFKRRDKLAVLDREFPGESCGNAECENLCAEALRVAKAMRLDPKIMLEDSIKQGIAPQTHCVPASARSSLPHFSPRLAASDSSDRTIILPFPNLRMIPRMFSAQSPVLAKNVNPVMELRFQPIRCKMKIS